MFQSPRSGKFVSNMGGGFYSQFGEHITFQSPRSGEFVSNNKQIDEGW